MRFPLLFLIPVSLALYTCTRANARSSAVPSSPERHELIAARNDGIGFVPLAYETTPNHEDTGPYPATPVKWTNKAIYRVGD